MTMTTAPFHPAHCLRALVLLAAGTIGSYAARAQADIENVIVETYYVSDANDATDQTGGGLAEGSRTYRVFIDLAPGRGLRAIYGNAAHPLTVGTTTTFFNHADRGRVFGHQIANGALDEGTTALDSWLSMGAASNQRRGIPKLADGDGSIVGGTNNDGGSAGIAGGLLVNNDPAAVIALTERDGLVALGTQPALPPTFNSQGDDLAPAFGDASFAGTFHSTDMRVACSTPGVQGADTDNLVLVAQLTTTGELTFQLNIEIQRPDGAIVKYVANDSALAAGETPFGALNYPPACGCTDPQFLEYDPLAGCDDGSCATTIVFGCMDPEACNYDPAANFSIAALCCYGPDNCNGLDPTLICPGLGTDGPEASAPLLQLYPNPAHDEVFVLAASVGTGQRIVEIMDLSGRRVHVESMEQGAPTAHRIDLGTIARGTYVLRLLDGPIVRAAILQRH